MKNLKILVVIFLVWALASPDSIAAATRRTATPPPPPAERTLAPVYRAILEVGSYSQLISRAGNGLEVRKSADGQTGYLVRAIPIESADHLVRLMGAAREGELSDGQKGLLNVYRFAHTDRIRTFLPLLPVSSGTVKLELNDTTGFEDSTRFPTVASDFWPRNSKTSWTSGNEIVRVDINIQMSPVDSSSFGQDAVKQMESTFIHEFAHSFDLAYGEADGYGPDGAHYINEVIKEKAAFIEGFAVFHQLLADPLLIPTYRWNLRNIKYEQTAGQYRDLDAKSEAVSGVDLMHVEGVQALMLYRLAKELPDGRQKIYDAFRPVNTMDKTFKTFLRELVRQNPAEAERITKIIDQESRRKLSNDQLRDYLGNSSGVNAYLTFRQDRIAQGLTNLATDSADPGYDPYASTSPQYLKKFPKIFRKPVRILESIQEHITRPLDTVKKKVIIKNRGGNPFSED